MKLRINKFTLSCVAVLSSAILFGVNGINVQAADSGTGSVNSVSTVQPKDEYTYVNGETAYGGFNYSGITWAVYKINGDDNNYQLRLGSTDGSVVEKPEQSQGTGNFDWVDYDSKITSVDIVGKLKANAIQQSLFEGLTNAKVISGLNLLDTSDTGDFSNMFKGDSSLESLDISDWNMSKETDTRNMFTGTHLVSLTLGPNSVITSSDLPSDPFEYMIAGNKYTANGWKDASGTVKPVSTTDLISTYSLGNTGRTQTTWVPNVIPESVDYYIQYADSSSGENLPVKLSKTYKGTTGESVNLSTATNGRVTLSQIGQLLPGYSADSIENETGTVSGDGNGGYAVKAEVKKLDSINIAVSQTVGTDKSTDASFKIPVNDASYKYSNITAPTNSTIDLNKSTIKIGDGTAESFASYSPTSKDLNSVLSGAITSQLKDGIFGDKAAGTTPITVNAVYTKKSTGGGSSSGNHHNNGNNNNEDNNTEDKGGTTSSVSQTVSTTTKDVNLYDNKGKLITNKALGKDSGWFSDQEYTLDGILYYRVASDEYVKASDVYVYTAQNNIVRVKGKSIVYMVDSVGHKITDRALSPDTEWYSDRYTMINGQKYYRVATNEFVSAADVSLL
ncbi:hypothetical protein CPR19088_GLDEOEPO_01405 [Companilactobacillus paralimentarius]